MAAFEFAGDKSRQAGCAKAMKSGIHPGLNDLDL
jgi:hypothetical protein